MSATGSAEGCGGAARVGERILIVMARDRGLLLKAMRDVVSRYCAKRFRPLKCWQRNETDVLVMGFRLVIMAVMGLGAMYMMHLLAQDWSRIRPIQGLTNLAGQVSNTLNLQRIPALAGQASSAVSAAFQRGKRDTLTKELGWIHGRPDAGGGGGTKEQRPTSSIDWKGILARDPFECLQSLICQLMSGAEAHAPEAELLMDFLESSLELAPAKIGRAFSRGLALRGNTESCYNEYPFCLYSAKVMLRILRWFSTTNTLPENV